MILFRYISRELLLTFLGILMVLLTVFVTNYFARLLSRAARGDLPADLLLQILALNLPYFLGVLLPLSFFLALLLVQGRLYADAELTAMQACGLSTGRLSRYFLVWASAVSLLCGVVCLWLAPMGLQQMEQLEQQSNQRTDLSLINPGTFQVLGSKVLFVANEDQQDKNRLNKILVFAEDPKQGVQVMFAEQGEYRFKPEYNSDYLELNRGELWQGQPGRADYDNLKFDSYQVKVKQRLTGKHQSSIKNRTLESLWASESLNDQAELQWRWSMPVSILVLTLLSIRVGRIRPRASKFARFLPGLSVYFVYFTLLTVARNLFEKSKLPAELGLWWVHLGFLVLALVLLWPEIRRRPR